jgi:hypothetical protein
MTPDFAYDYIDAACHEYRIGRDVFFYRVRIPAAAQARAVCAYLLHKRRKVSSTSAAKWLKFKSHTSVLESTRRVGRLLINSAEFRERVNEIERKVEHAEFVCDAGLRGSDRGDVLRVLSDQPSRNVVTLAPSAHKGAEAGVHVSLPKAHAAYLARDRGTLPSGPYYGAARRKDGRRPLWMRLDVVEAARMVRDETLREGRDRADAPRKPHWFERLKLPERTVEFARELVTP